MCIRDSCKALPAEPASGTVSASTPPITRELGCANTVVEIVRHIINNICFIIEFLPIKIENLHK